MKDKIDKACDKNELINPKFDKLGYIQVYTGEGKGKTTASLGLALRALGRGWKVLIIMFTKGGSDYGELFAFQNLSQEIKERLKIIQAGLDRIVWKSNVTPEDHAAVAQGWQEAKNAVKSGEYQLIILDEANIAIDLELIDIEEMVELLKNKLPETEIVLTGRNACDKVIELAHLVSEIKPVKHYWDIGVLARKGIEY